MSIWYPAPPPQKGAQQPSPLAETWSSFNGQTVADKTVYCIKVEYSRTVNSFMWFPSYFYSRLGVHASQASFIAFLQSLVPDIASLDHQLKETLNSN